MTDEDAAPLSRGRDNVVGRRTSVARLNGRVYTPDDVARALVGALPLRDGDRVLDPACGDGAWLAAVAARAEGEGIRLELVGWDVDPAAVDAARARLPGARIVHRDALAPTDERFDLVVGNPPYLEGKRMPDALKARVRAVAPVAGRGAFDLYAAFVELATRWTRPGGAFALLVPNRLLVARHAAALRARLLASGRLEVVDLSAADVFGSSASVYPVLARWTAGASGYVVERGDGRVALDVADVADLPTLPLPWPGAPGALLAHVLGRRFPTVGDVHDVRWTVSFHRDGLRDRFVHETRPASPHARPFLGGGRYAGNREVAPYRIDWAGAFIDHDEARARAEGNPLPPASLFDGEKVVICQHARRARAALDADGLVLKDTFLLARPRRPDPAASRWLLLVLHADVSHVLHEQLLGGTRKGGGYLHFLGGLVARLPLPPCPDPECAVRLHDALARGEDVRGEAEALARRAYGVPDEVERWLDEASFPPS